MIVTCAMIVALGSGAGAPARVRAEETEENTISVSAATGQNIHELKEMLGRLAPKEDTNRVIIRDILQQLGTFINAIRCNAITSLLKLFDQLGNLMLCKAEISTVTTVGHVQIQALCLRFTRAQKVIALIPE